MNRFNRNAFVLFVLLSAFGFWFVFRRSSPRWPNETEEHKPVPVSCMTPTNTTVLEENSFADGEVLDSEMERAPASAIYPDTIWDKEFRANRPKDFDNILTGFEGRGALAPIVLTAINEKGSPVPGASVRLSFSSPDGIDNPVVRSGHEASGDDAVGQRM